MAFKWFYHILSKATASSKEDYAINCRAAIYRTHDDTAKDYHNPVIENFRGDNRLFIAAEIDDNHDLKAIAKLAHTHPEVKFLVTPPIINEERLNRMAWHFSGNTRLYSQCTPETALDKVQILIIDYIADRQHLYEFGTWCYMGHGISDSPIDAAIPIACGLRTCSCPPIRKEPFCRSLIRRGVISVVRNSTQLNEWFCRHMDCHDIGQIPSLTTGAIPDNTSVI